jgi:hypothetical protein
VNLVLGWEEQLHVFVWYLQRLWDGDPAAWFAVFGWLVILAFLIVQDYRTNRKNIRSVPEETRPPPTKLR